MQHSPLWRKNTLALRSAPISIVRRSERPLLKLSCAYEYEAPTLAKIAKRVGTSVGLMQRPIYEAATSENGLDRLRLGGSPCGSTRSGDCVLCESSDGAL